MNEKQKFKDVLIYPVDWIFLNNVKFKTGKKRLADVIHDLIKNKQTIRQRNNLVE